MADSCGFFRSMCLNCKSTNILLKWLINGFTNPENISEIYVHIKQLYGVLITYLLAKNTKTTYTKYVCLMLEFYYIKIITFDLIKISK